MDPVQLVERDVNGDGRLTLRLLMSNQPHDVEVYKLEGNMLDVTIDEAYRMRFWFPFIVSDKKLRCLVNNRAVIINLYS